MSKSIIKNRLANVRAEMDKKGMNALIVLAADPHLSEYLPEHWQIRQWLSGFTGSAGMLVVTANYAAVWADSRYWIQAAEQLSETGIELQKWEGGNTHTQWLADNLPVGSSVEINADMLSVTDEDVLLAAFVRKSIKLFSVAEDSAAKNYNAEGRPALPMAPMFRHKPEFVSLSAKDKLTQVREGMAEHGASHHLISSVDDIGWLTNLRGADVDYNPVFLAHMLISAESAILFVDQSKVSEELKKDIADADITLANYESVQAEIGTLAASDSLLFDPSKVAVGTLLEVTNGVTLIKAIAPSTFLKSMKSSEDIENVREAMRQDGVALCEFYAEFERRIDAGERLSELDVDSMLIEYRSQQPHYVSPSFPTIAGYNANGALPHYRATEESFSYFEGDGLLLIDSGAQYHNGTTDITRIVPIGTINEEHKRDFTVVLKAHIALAVAYFPEGIPSPLVDAITRAPLWAEQMDFGHGTGHGVGYFMNVHEGPQKIALGFPARPETAMRAGMITSDEPGLYRENKWGIRIENLMVNMPVENPSETAFGHYLYFETVTYCPHFTQLVNKDMLTEKEINWFNDYQKQVFDELNGREMSEQALAWLTKTTQPI